MLDKAMVYAVTSGPKTIGMTFEGPEGRLFGT